MLVLYRGLLRLYPADYFREYGAEMTLVFAQANDAVAQKKLTERAIFHAREVSGLIKGALQERLFGSYDSSSSRRSDMRFRFPRSTVFLMWVILAGVLLAIAEAKLIATQYGAVESRSMWSMLSWFPLAVVLLIFAAAGAVWGILFALQRTGIHRLEKMQTGESEHRP